MNSLVIKGNKYGLTLVMESDADYDDIKSQLIQKIKESAKFFKKATMAISFEGKVLSKEQQLELIKIIEHNSEMNIVYIVDQDTEEYFKNIVENYDNPSPAPTSIEVPIVQAETQLINYDEQPQGKFYKGTLRSGQSLESDSSIVILGDVNPGANVIANGNIVILGTLKGNAYAGANGNENCIVVALEMQPMQIRIADVIARCADKPVKTKNPIAKIAFVEDGNIYIEKLDKDIIADINL